MTIKTAHDLLVSQLRDIHSAEKQAIRLYPKIAKASRSEELSEALEAHLTQTEGQLERLHRVSEVLGKKISGKTCEAMEGFVEELHQALKHIAKGPLLDAAIIAVSQQVEHNEIATYGTAAALAEALGETEVHSLLAATLEEEKVTDTRLSDIARQVNAQWATKEGEDEVDEEAPDPSPVRAVKKPARSRTTAKVDKS